MGDLIPHPQQQRLRFCLIADFLSASLFGSKLGFSRILDSLSSAHSMHDFTDFRLPNFTKFEHKKSMGIAMNPH